MLNFFRFRNLYKSIMCTTKNTELHQLSVLNKQRLKNIFNFCTTSWIIFQMTPRLKFSVQNEKNSCTILTSSLWKTIQHGRRMGGGGHGINVFHRHKWNHNISDSTNICLMPCSHVKLLNHDLIRWNIIINTCMSILSPHKVNIFICSFIWY